MRPVRSIAALTALLVASAPLAGCFVLDELDKSQAMLPKHSPKDKPADAKPKAGSAGRADGKDAKASWWAQARSLNTGPVEEDRSDDASAVVRCELHSAVRFMRRGDCLSQGGRLPSP